MQPHRIDPSAQAPLIPARPPRVGSAVGLGLTDALRVDLMPCQLSAFAEEIDALREPLQLTLDRARAEWDDVANEALAAGATAYRDAEEELAAAAYRVRLLAAISSQLPATTAVEPVTIVGPAGMVSTLIANAVANAASKLAARIPASVPLDESAREDLRLRASALNAWVNTYVDCCEIVWFRLDTNWDPVHPD